MLWLKRRRGESYTDLAVNLDSLNSSDLGKFFDHHWMICKREMHQAHSKEFLVHKDNVSMNVEAVMRYIVPLFKSLMNLYDERSNISSTIDFINECKIWRRKIVLKSSDGDIFRIYEQMLSLLHCGIFKFGFQYEYIHEICFILAEMNNIPLEMQTQTRALDILMYLTDVLCTKSNFIEWMFAHMVKEENSYKFQTLSLLVKFVFSEETLQSYHAKECIIQTLSCPHAKKYEDYIAKDSDFCSLLVAGIGALYSELPTSKNYTNMQMFVEYIGSSSHFLDGFKFITKVINIAPNKIANALKNLVYNSFICTIIYPSIINDQSLENIPENLLESLFLNDMDVKVTATFYLDSMIKNSMNSDMLSVFITFLLKDSSELLNVLSERIKENNKLGSASLYLLLTIVGLNSEDLFFQSIFRYLISCTHIMWSQLWLIPNHLVYRKLAIKMKSCLITKYETTFPIDYKLISNNAGVVKVQQLDSWKHTYHRKQHKSIFADNTINSFDSDLIYDVKCPSTPTEKSNEEFMSELDEIDVGTSYKKDDLETSVKLFDEMDSDVAILYIESTSTAVSVYFDALTSFHGDTTATLEHLAAVEALTPAPATATTASTATNASTAPADLTSATCRQTPQRQPSTPERTSRRPNDRILTPLKIDFNLSPRSLGANARHSTPLKCPKEKCDIGPFLTNILDKYENFPVNSFADNIYLLGILSELCCSPQDLLRSLLLNSTIVLQPSAKCLTSIVKEISKKYADVVRKYPGFLLWMKDGVQKMNRGVQEVMFDINEHSFGTSNDSLIMSLNDIRLLYYDLHHNFSTRERIRISKNTLYNMLIHDKFVLILCNVMCMQAEISNC